MQIDGIQQPDRFYFDGTVFDVGRHSLEKGVAPPDAIPVRHACLGDSIGAVAFNPTEVWRVGVFAFVRGVCFHYEEVLFQTGCPDGEVFLTRLENAVGVHMCIHMVTRVACANIDIVFSDSGECLTPLSHDEWRLVNGVVWEEEKPVSEVLQCLREKPFKLPFIITDVRAHENPDVLVFKAYAKLGDSWHSSHARARALIL